MIFGSYTSVWSDGSTESNCIINSKKMAVDNLEVFDCGSEFDDLISDHVIVVAPVSKFNSGDGHFVEQNHEQK